MYFNKQLWDMTLTVRHRIALSVLMGGAGILLSLCRLLLLGWLINRIFAGESLAEVWPEALLTLGIMCLFAFWEFQRLQYAHQTAALVQKQIRSRLFQQIIKLGPAHFVHTPSGELSSAAVEGVEQLEIYFGRYLPQFFLALITPVLLFFVVSWLDVVVALVLLTAALFTLLAPMLFHRWDRHNSLRRASAYRQFGAEFLDALQGLPTLKAFGQSTARERRLAEKAAELFKSTMWVLATNSLTRGITDLGITLGAAAALAVAAYRVDQGLMSYESLIMVLLLGMEVFRPLRELRALLHDGMLAESAADSVMQVLQASPLVRDREPKPYIITQAHSSDDSDHAAQQAGAFFSHAAGDPSLLSSITFDQVDFAYPGDRASKDASKGVHHQLSFKVAAGERIGIVGSSGGGKSTIVRLLLRFYDPQAGSVRIGDKDIKELALEQLRGQFAVVSQDMHLFHGSVRENLMMGKADASEQELLSAARNANALDYIEQLPQGFDTIIGERGVRLSGGQRQRLAIARALLRDAPILILDEALSSVDAKNEAEIQSALNSLMQGRTTLILAHRLSSIIDCDRILVLDQGCVVEQGSHQQLMQRAGVYTRLMSSQTTQLSKQEKAAAGVVDSGMIAAQNTMTARAEEPSSKPASRLDQDILTSDASGWSSVLTQLFRFAAPWKRQVIATFILGLTRVSAYIGVGLLSALTAAAVKNEADYSHLLLWLLVCALVAAVVHWLESWLAHDMAFRMLTEMRLALFRKLDQLAPAFMLRHRSGDVINLATHDIEMVEYFFAHTIAPVFVAAVVPMSVLFFLAWFDMRLALGLLPFLLVVALIPLLLRRRLDQMAAQARQQLGALSAHTLETLQGLAEVLINQAGSQRQAQFTRLIEQHHAARLPFFREMAWQTVITDLLTVMAGLAVILLGAPLITPGVISADYLPALTIASMAAFLPLTESANAGRQLAETYSATRRLLQVQNCEPQVSDSADPQPIAALQPGTPQGLAVSFEEVSFHYESQKHYAIDHFSLSIPAGIAYALVGASGAGKSTLAHLLLRFWDPQSGKICLGGTDLKHIALADLRQQVALVAQDTYLFNDSLRENLLMAKPDATEQELMQALKSAELTGFVENLQQGLETEVGERGFALSGGQRQRVSIARAFLRDAPVLILDEATSQLDAASEQAVQIALAKLMQNRTTLIIAHRLATIRQADQIVVMDEGRVIEQGTHAELLANNHNYAQLLRYQSQSAV
ncbi:unnamed protein product [Cyprideis torosa]|uniref:ABC transporter n=1 Tax=Cyprideis torosa TaxID=163714 RepID=A0A7R8W2I3_9CRUS|nr:unnamed protein product [Cyprideis torosa]CAG0882010.1 unnamed protein product [Cyprideis torosa]